ncbi:MAG TPA: DUF983 domain-containing protein [Acidimicrobiales bacterium]|nr:DUF983 domain-containing protein [Acidimicrobiales bacterium]
MTSGPQVPDRSRAAVAAPPSTWRMLGRGIVRRCPRCGAGRLFPSWFRMVEDCPGCDLRFERENDFFLGAYVINLGVTEGLLLVGLFAYIFAAVNDPDLPVAPVVVAAVVLAVIGPLVFFPFSRTIWSAIDLAMRPQPMERSADDEDGERPA